MTTINVWTVTIENRHMMGSESTPFSTEKAAKKFAADYARERYEDHIDNDDELPPMSDDDVLAACWGGDFMGPDNGSIEITSRKIRLPDDPLRDAAPDMLAALKALVEWGREHTSPLDPNSPHALLIAGVAAIAKAEGRLPAEPRPCPACKGLGAFPDTGLDCAECLGGGEVLS